MGRALLSSILQIAKRSIVLKPMGQTVALCTRKVVCNRNHGFMKKKNKSEDLLAGRYCLLDSEHTFVA